MLLLTRLFLRIVHMNNRSVILVSVLFILFTSGLAYALEPDVFGTYFNGFWWVMTTVTTVGYGDFYPHTVPGKCLGIVVYIFGIGLISITISKVVEALFFYQRRKEEGKLRYTGEQHVVIIDWSKNAELAIQEILNTDAKTEVVLIDTLEKTPIQHERVHYIQGNPVHHQTLELANLSRARAVMIFADEVTRYQNVVRDSSFIDGKTLLVATAIERGYSHVHTIAEIKDRENLPNFEHVQINEFILSNDTVSQLAVRAAFHPGTTKLLSQLLTHQDGEDLYEVAKRESWVTFRDAFLDLLNQGATLISDGTDLAINRRMEEPIPPNARLFVICSRETYRTLTRDSSGSA